MIDFKQLACLNRDELLENVVPFWLTHSQDERYGGYFTCLDRGGDVYDTDKFVWLQGRQVWLFSTGKTWNYIRNLFKRYESYGS